MKKPLLLSTIFLVVYQASGHTYVDQDPLPPPIHDAYYFSYPVSFAINGQAYRNKILIQFRANSIYIDRRILHFLNQTAQKKPFLASLVHSKAPFISLLNIHQPSSIKVFFDKKTNQLNITVPASWLNTQYIQLNKQDKAPPYAKDPGLILSYDAYYLREPANTRSLSTIFSSNLFTHYGNLYASVGFNMSYSPTDTDSAFQEQVYLQDIRWVYNDLQRNITYVIGDNTTDNASWHGAVRMGGISISKDYHLQPDYNTAPLPIIEGTAKIPSSIDLFINGQKIANEDINPGPFSISNIPFINGSGEATIVTTDHFGRQVTTTVQLYNSSELLRQGLYTYHVSIGELSYYYYEENNRYKHFFASGTYQRGLTDQITLALHTEQAKNLNLAGGNITTLLGHYGVLNTALLYSHNEKGNGYQYGLGYSYNTQRSAFTINSNIYSKNYRDLTDYGTDLPTTRLSAQTSYSYTINSNYSLGSGVFYIKDNTSTKNLIANLSLSRANFFHGNLMLSLSQNFSSHETSGMLSVSLPISDNIQTSISSNFSNNANYQSIALSRTPSQPQGLGWDLLYNKENGISPGYIDASVNWQNDDFALQGGVYGEQALNYWAEINGSIVVMGKHVFPTEQASNGFAIINTDGIAGVPYYYNGAYYGKTDSSGIGFVNNVVPYTPATFTIDTSGLALDIRAKHAEKHIRVRQESGALLDFGLKSVTPKMIQAVDKHNTPLSIGSTVTFADHSTSFIGFDGDLYIPDASFPQLITVSNNSGESCMINYIPRKKSTSSLRYSCTIMR